MLQTCLSSLKLVLTGIIDSSPKLGHPDQHRILLIQRSHLKSNLRLPLLAQRTISVMAIPPPPGHLGHDRHCDVPAPADPWRTSLDHRRPHDLQLDAREVRPAGHKPGAGDVVLVRSADQHAECVRDQAAVTAHPAADHLGLERQQGHPLGSGCAQEGDARHRGNPQRLQPAAVAHHVFRQYAGLADGCLDGAAQNERVRRPGILSACDWVVFFLVFFWMCVGAQRRVVGEHILCGYDCYRIFSNSVHINSI